MMNLDISSRDTLYRMAMYEGLNITGSVGNHGKKGHRKEMGDSLF
jgi:hypothetical protein